MSQMRLKVSDHDLFLTYFSMSNRSLEENGTVDAFWECLGQVQRSLTLNYFLPTFLRQVQRPVMAPFFHYRKCS